MAEGVTEVSVGGAGATMERTLVDNHNNNRRALAMPLLSSRVTSCRRNPRRDGDGNGDDSVLRVREETRGCTVSASITARSPV
jgi:hypothetical protein